MSILTSTSLLGHFVLIGKSSTMWVISLCACNMGPTRNTALSRNHNKAQLSANIWAESYFNINRSGHTIKLVVATQLSHQCQGTSKSMVSIYLSVVEE